MTTLLAVRQAIQTQISAAIPGVTVYDAPPATITGVAVIIGLPEQINYHGTMGGAGVGFFGEMVFPIAVLVPVQTAEEASRNLGLFIDVAGPNSIPAALEADQSLGGVLDSNASAVLGAIPQASPIQWGDMSGQFFEAATIHLKCILKRG